jgi:TPR repeat protein
MKYIKKITLILFLLLSHSVFTQNDELAVILFRQALNALEQGNFAQAFTLFHDSASRGYHPAMNNIAYMYQYGKGILPDTTEAVSRYHKAVELGSLSAVYNIGICYYYGIGLTKDPKKAFEWLSYARRQGHEKSNRFLMFREHPETSVYWSEFLGTTNNEAPLKPLPAERKTEIQAPPISPRISEQLTKNEEQKQNDNNNREFFEFIDNFEKQESSAPQKSTTDETSALKTSRKFTRKNFLSIGKSGFGTHQKKARDFELKNEFFLTAGHFFTPGSGPFATYKRADISNGAIGSLDTLQVGYRFGVQNLLKTSRLRLKPWLSVFGEQREGRLTQIGGIKINNQANVFDFGGQIGLGLKISRQLQINIFAESAGKSVYFSDENNNPVELRKNSSLNVGWDLLF